MALIDDCIAWFPSARLKQLTNGQDAAAAQAGIDMDRLQLACDAAEADFQVYGELEYDGDDVRHVPIARLGVIAHLKESIGQDPDDATMKTFHGRLKTLKGTTSRGRVAPATSSRLDPTDDDLDADGMATPDFDRSHFSDLVPRPPGRRGDGDDSITLTDDE